MIKIASIILLTIFILSVKITFSQKMEITTFENAMITVEIIDSATKSQLIKELNGKQENKLRKEWTARTFVLNNRRIIVEFYDKNAVIINNLEQFSALERVRFVKNTIWNLKKNISYKIELSYREGQELLERDAPKRLKQYVSESPEWLDFEVYELKSGQILFIDKSNYRQDAAIFPDIKTLASEQSSVLETEYGFKDEEYLMKKLASGDILSDYDEDYHLIYPKYLNSLIENHKLKLEEQNVYVSPFYGNLYKSENGYYILVDDVMQKNGGGNTMEVLSLRIYETLQQVRDAEFRYEKFKNLSYPSGHFMKPYSDKYGRAFLKHIPQLIDSLPLFLNFDKEQLSFDSLGMTIVDEALKWNETNYRHFYTWFPSILAYYGECYILAKKDCGWKMRFDKEYKVWLPEVMLKNGNKAWDLIDFYADLAESPIPLKWAGDWNRDRKYWNRAK